MKSLRDLLRPKELNLTIKRRIALKELTCLTEVKNGVSAQTLYKEYSSVELLPSYQNFTRYFRLHKKAEKAPEVSLKIDRIPEQTIEVDYSGDKMEILNLSTGEILVTELFVAALSFSS